MNSSEHQLQRLFLINAADSFKYDPFGRRIYKSSPGGTSIFTYEGGHLVEETNSAGSIVARYSQGMNIDEPLAMLRSAATSYYQVDGLGSVTSLSNAAGAVAQTYAYDSFGKQTTSSGSLTSPFQYTGRESDSETGLYYYRARYYDPIPGRFLSEDPLGFDGEDANFYAYVGNNPSAWTDPDGLRKYKCTLFGGCYKIPFGPGLSKGCPCKGGARLPDFVSTSLSIAVPWTGGWGSWTLSGTLDRYGHTYWSPIGPGLGRSGGSVSGTVAPEWSLQKCTPSSDQLSNLLSGHGLSGAAGYGGGIAGSCNKKLENCAAGAGLVSPQIGGNYSYSFSGPDFKFHW
jgi:RHS repeat-associated protein